MQTQIIVAHLKVKTLWILETAKMPNSGLHVYNSIAMETSPNPGTAGGQRNTKKGRKSHTLKLSVGLVLPSVPRQSSPIGCWPWEYTASEGAKIIRKKVFYEFRLIDHKTQNETLRNETLVSPGMSCSTGPGLGAEALSSACHKWHLCQLLASAFITRASEL